MKRTDIRQIPLYSVGEISKYTRVPYATLRLWTAPSASPLIALADYKSASPYSFINLVETHVLAALRKIHKISMPKIKRAVHYLAQECNTKNPLAECDLETNNRDIFFRKLGLPISASESGQFAFPQILNLYLKRIERDRKNIPVRFFPLTYDDCPKSIVIDPAVAYGRPVINGTRISTSIIFDRYTGGEGLVALAKDYDLNLAFVEEALRCEVAHQHTN